MNLNYIGKSKKYSSFSILAAASVCFTVGVFLHHKSPRPIINVSTQDSAINFSTLFLKLGSMGNKRLISDMIWTQTLLQSDVEQYNKRDLNNWMFLRFNTISELDPQFYENYLYGGQFLAIIKDDLEGSTLIFEKGLTVYPDDYRLNYNAGFVYFFEKNDYKNGLQKLERIQYDAKAPVFLPSIVNKLKLQTGELDLQSVYELVYNQYQSAVDETLKAKLRRDLYAIKAEIDLKCLEQNLARCDRSDLNGDPYLYNGQHYQAKDEFKPYRLNKKGSQSSP